MNGKFERHPEAVYHLRYLRDGKRVWEAVGSDAQEALNRQHQREMILNAQEAGIEVVDPTVTGRSFEAAKKEYLSEVRKSKSEETHRLYEYALRLFSRGYSKSTLEAITRQDVLAFRDALVAMGNGDRSVVTHLTSVRTFLNHFEVKWPLMKTDRIRVVEKVVSPYSLEEIQGLLRVADQNEADLVHFLLCTGGRKQEVMYASWADVDFHGRTFKVSQKKDLGFTPKDREEGLIPIPETLVELLRARRARVPQSRRIFSLPDKKPEDYLLQVIKTLAYKAGLNCGECHHKPRKGCKTGQCCATSPTCH
ncbi:MAG: site-specific integrase [Terracidiphilus sp.]